MSSENVIILETNTDYLRELKAEAERRGRYAVKYVGDDGEEALCVLAGRPVDAAFVGVFLKGADGCDVVRRLRAEYPVARIVVAGVAGDALMKRAVDAGADAYLVKPFSAHSAFDAVESLKEAKEATAAERGEKSPAESRIGAILLGLSVRPHLRGYACLLSAVLRTVERPYILGNPSGELYPALAEEFQMSVSAVRSAMRHAVRVTWKADPDAAERALGRRVGRRTGEPSVCEFVALVADKYILENLV